MSNNNFKEWLEKLQQESWHLELIISGFAIFGLVQAQHPVSELYDWFDASNEFILFFPVKLILWILKLAIVIFLMNLIFHVILRGLWIGTIGLRYVSGDIDFEQLNYNETFDKYLKSKVGNFDKYIERLENFTSSIFSFTFILFFILFSIVFFLALWTLVLFAFASFSDNTDFYSRVDIGNPIIGILFLLFVVFTAISLLLVVIDFLSLGLLKKVRNKRFSKFFFICYRFMSLVSLSFIWRPIWLNFIDNKFTRKFVYFVPLYFFLIFTIPNLRFESDIYFPNLDPSNEKLGKAVFKNAYSYIFYDDERESQTGKKVPIAYFSIPSKTISSSK